MAAIYGEGMVNLRPQLAQGFAPQLASFLGPIGTKAGLAFAGAFAAGFALVKIGATFQDAINQIRVDTGATGEALKGLEDDFKAVFSTVPADAGAAATAIADLNTRLGLTGPALQDLSRLFLELSRITKSDVGENIRAATRLFGDWDVATENQADTLDMLFRASQNSGASVQKLSENVVQFGAPMRQLGFRLEESIALFARFEREGVNTETVMAGLRQAVAKLTREGADLPVAFAEIIESLQGTEVTAADTARALEVFGARAGPDMVAAIQEGRFELDELLSLIEGGSDTILTAAEDTMTWREDLQVLWQDLQTKLQPIATQAFRAIGAAVGALTVAFEILEPAIDLVVGGFSRLVEWMSVAVGWISETKIVLGLLAPIAIAAGAALFLAWTTALGPIGKALVAITAIVAALEWIARNFDEIISDVNEKAGGGGIWGWLGRTVPFIPALPSGHSGAMFRDEGLLVGQRGEFLVDRDTTGRLIEMLNDSIIDRGNGMFDGAAFNFFGSPEQMVTDVGRRVGLEVRVA